MLVTVEPTEELGVDGTVVGVRVTVGAVGRGAVTAVVWAGRGTVATAVVLEMGSVLVDERGRRGVLTELAAPRATPPAMRTETAAGAQATTRRM